jgi:hypothetical protein
MKTFTTILIALFLVCNLSNAQDSLFIYKSGSIVSKRAVADIDSITFKTSTLLVQLPVLTTTSVTNVTQSTATSGGNVTYDGGATVTKRGVCWSTITSPTTALTTKTTDAGSAGTFTSTMSNLAANTTYFVRAYATNSAGTAYGNEQTFITKAIDNGFGGIMTQYISNGVVYAVHTFTYDANFYPPANLTHARILLVGSGGAGGGDTINNVGGGGGGGQVREMDIAISGSSMPVKISVGASTITSFGGETVINGSKGAGGTGGGGGTSGNGKNGGVGLFRAGGGGGGASFGFDGVPDNWNPKGGNGGDGVANDITGISTYYGGGGGGGAWTGYSGTTGKGGLGGGGGGWGTKGTANTGGGGSGASYSSGGGSTSYTLGAAGGSGVVIICYPL